MGNMLSKTSLLGTKQYLLNDKSNGQDYFYLMATRGKSREVVLCYQLPEYWVLIDID
jgi:hypothetical protein